MQNEKPNLTKKRRRSFTAPQNLCDKINKIQICPRNASKKIRCKLSLRAAQALGATCHPQKTAFCQIPKTFALSQNEKPKMDKKSRGAVSLRPKPREEKSTNFKFARISEAKRFVENSRYARPKRWERPAALKKRHFSKFQRLSHFCKTKNPNQPQTPCGKINQTSIFCPHFRGKKIRFKFLLRLAKSSPQHLQPKLGPPLSKNGILPNSKGFRIFAKVKKQTKPKKSRSAAKLRPKPTQKKGYSFAAPQIPCGKINKFQICPRKVSKKIRCKLSLRAAQALGATRHLQKTALCQIPKAFALLQTKNPNRQKKQGRSFAAPHNKN